ncbi:MAG: hypothetical protein IJI25_08755 [Eubacterium sp.]|nr:hypothetical protein [Eubacterium sp.]
MGGRGASSGLSDKGNPYGSQYHEIFSDGNIKFVTKNSRQSETLMETMTQGRVYVTVGINKKTGDGELLSIIYFDIQNKRIKTIDLNHPHKGMQPHTHHGYRHNENDGSKGASKLTPAEQKMVDRVIDLWDDYIKSKP